MWPALHSPPPLVHLGCGWRRSSAPCRSFLLSCWLWPRQPVELRGGSCGSRDDHKGLTLLFPPTGLVSSCSSFRRWTEQGAFTQAGFSEDAPSWKTTWYSRELFVWHNTVGMLFQLMDLLLFDCSKVAINKVKFIFPQDFKTTKEQILSSWTWNI